MNSVCVGTKDPQTGPLAQFGDLWVSYGAFGPVLGHSAPPQEGGGAKRQTDKQTDKHFVIIYEYDEIPKDFFV